jgi:flavin reductase (DIM6/NTAB) family NADH-FMN oxidoreductase RutF
MYAITLRSLPEATVVTAADANGPAGYLVLSVTHLCTDPPMMLVSIGKTT